MKKRNIVLTLLSVCGVITTFAFVAANTVRTNNARQSVVSTEGFGNSEIALNKDIEEKEELPSYEKEVTKGVAVSVPIPPSEEETEEEEEAGLEAMELVGLEFSFEELCLEDSFFEELSEVVSDSI